MLTYEEYLPIFPLLPIPWAGDGLDICTMNKTTHSHQNICSFNMRLWEIGTLPLDEAKVQ